MSTNPNRRIVRDRERSLFPKANSIGGSFTAPEPAKQPLRKKLLAKGSVKKKSVVTKPAPKKPVPKKPVPKKPPIKVPPLGPFGQILLQNFKNMPPGTPDSAVIMETLRSLPPDQLKASLKKATPKERKLLFSVLPGDQIKSILGSLPTTVLAPDRPPLPPPSPKDGPPASILMTTYENVPFPPGPGDPFWAQKFTGGKTIDLDGPLEWMSVYDRGFEKEGSLNNPMVGLTGWAVHREKSEGDVWFTHPFGFDYEFYIVPDRQYEGLLSASNTSITPGSGAVDSSYAAAIASAKNIELKTPKGVLGVETDQGLLPQSFQDLIKDGTRVAVFGRWIIDCGHPDFHTEIHPPLLLAVANPAPPPAGTHGASEMTSVAIMSRPFTVSQRFEEGNFVDHLKSEVIKVETTLVDLPLSTQVEAHPTVFTTPYEGRPFIKLLVQPPHKLGPPNVGIPQHLMVSYHFTHRTGVAIQVFDAGNGTVGIFIVLGDLNPAQLPPKHDLNVSWDEVRKFDENAVVVQVIELVDIISGGNSLAAHFLDRGVLTDIYDPPSATSPRDNQNVASAVGVNRIQPGAGLSEDDNQPFPIYGWLNVWWQEDPPVDHSTNIPSTM